MDRGRQAGRDQRNGQGLNGAEFRTAPRSERRHVPNGAKSQTAPRSERREKPKGREVPKSARCQTAQDNYGDDQRRRRFLAICTPLTPLRS